MTDQPVVPEEFEEELHQFFEHEAMCRADALKLVRSGISIADARRMGAADKVINFMELMYAARAGTTS